MSSTLPSASPTTSSFPFRYRESVVHRFLRYVRVDTQSAENQGNTPSTAKQWDLVRMLASELEQLSAQNVRTSEHGMVVATVPATVANADAIPTVGFLAHVDTSPAVTGASVQPVVHENYQGGDIVLPGDPTQVITVAQNPDLEKLKGDDIITTDGTTLLGSDDKAGVAAIMTLVDVLLSNPSIPHGAVAVAFTTDEEIGTGIEKFDIEAFGARYAYTVDGGPLGELNDETFSARTANVTFHGKSTHPGTAKGVMVNAIHALAAFVARLPHDMRPETTEKRVGFVHPYIGTADVETSSLKVLLRDFDLSGLETQEGLLRDIARETERACCRGEGGRGREGELPQHARGGGAASRAHGERHGGGAACRRGAVPGAHSRRHGRIEAHVPRASVSQHLHRRPQLPQQAGVQLAARVGEDGRDVGGVGASVRGRRRVR